MTLEKDKPKKRFLPPLLKIPDALELVMDSTRQLSESEESQNSNRKCFLKVGLAQDPALQGEFRKFTGLKVVSTPVVGPKTEATTTEKLLEMTVIGEEVEEEETTGEDCLDD